MAKIFVSYTAKDRARVALIVNRLRALRLDVFWDQDIPNGASWQDSIDQALKAAKCVLVLWSQASVLSKDVREEAIDGENRGLLVGALIEACTPPRGHATQSFGDLRKWRGDFNDLVWLKLVADIAGKAGAIWAAEWEAHRAGIERDAHNAELLAKAADRADAWIAANRHQPIAPVAEAFMAQHAPEIRRAREKRDNDTKSANALKREADDARFKQAARNAARRAFIAAHRVTISALVLAVTIGAVWAWRNSYSFADVSMRGEAERLALPLGHLGYADARFTADGAVVVESARVFDENATKISVWSPGGALAFRIDGRLWGAGQGGVMLRTASGLEFVSLPSQHRQALELPPSAGNANISGRMSRDGRWAAISITNGDGEISEQRGVTAGVWSVADGSRVSTLERSGETGAASIAAISADGAWVAGEDGPREFAVWNARTGRRVMSRRMAYGFTTFAPGPDNLVTVTGRDGAFIVDMAAQTWRAVSVGCFGNCRAVRERGDVRFMDVRREGDSSIMRIRVGGARSEARFPPGVGYCSASIAHGGEFAVLVRNHGARNCGLVTLYRLEGDALHEAANWPVASEPNIEISEDDSRILVMDQNGAMLLRVPAL